MANPKNQAQVEEALRSELERDRTKTYVVEISPLGLVEMTRQNVTDGPREILTRKCPVCAGDGIVVSDQTVALEVERRLRALAAPGSRVQAYRVAMHPRTLSLLAGPGGSRLAAIEEAAKKRFFLVPAENGHVHPDHFEVLAEGKLADLQPPAPVEEGGEVEVKLVEVGLYDAGAGVGKLDGLDVVVGDAARLVGKKAKVLVGRVLDGQVFASLAEREAVEGPITFESEAEKPTRAPARRKAAPASGAPDEVVAEGPEEAGEEADEAEAAADDAGEVSADAGDVEAAAKKRTRRGSRGGRRRKRKPAEGAEESADAETVAAENAAQPAQEVAPEPAPEPPPRPRRQRTPRIHVPAADLEAAPANGDGPAEEAAALPDEAVDAVAEAPGADGEQPGPRKRTRRGTRGGRNRRRKPAGEGAAEAAATDGEVVEPVDLAVEEPTPAADEPASEKAGYVPMAEWLDDFDG